MTVATYRRLLREAAGVGAEELRVAGADVAERLQSRWPELVSELEGIAQGARQDVLELAAINARTELLAGTPRSECSVIGRMRGPSVTLAQTWDWHPDLRPAALLWTVIRADGSWFTTATEAGILAKLGVNRHGVACALNFLTCSADGAAGGIPIHVLLRLVLERCSTGAEALLLLRDARTAASSCITIAAASPGGGELFAAELTPGGARIVRPDADGWLVHTNHFLAAPAAGFDTQPDLHPGTLLRRRQLVGLVRSGVSPLDALARHEPSAEPVCRHDDPPGTPWPDRRATLLAIDIEPAGPSLRLAAGPPCAVPFEAVRLPGRMVAAP